MKKRVLNLGKRVKISKMIMITYEKQFYFELHQISSLESSCSFLKTSLEHYSSFYTIFNLLSLAYFMLIMRST
jgi:hypothetical protein